jgi:hypothetical protein
LVFALILVIGTKVYLDVGVIGSHVILALKLSGQVIEVLCSESTNAAHVVQGGSARVLRDVQVQSHVLALSGILDLDRGRCRLALWLRRSTAAPLMRALPVLARTLIVNALQGLLHLLQVLEVPRDHERARILTSDRGVLIHVS